MGYNWKEFKLPRLYGLDKKTNIIDVKDGYSRDNSNVFQDFMGVISKRKGNAIMFSNDGDESSIQEIGSATLAGTKYYFKFAAGNFYYTTSLTGSVTTITPSPAISTSNKVWWAVLDNKIFFVDGTNALRYFNGTTISISSIYGRPNQVLSGGGAGNYTYTYTIDNGLGESPANIALLTTKADAATMTLTSPVTLADGSNQALVAGDRIRIYSRPDTNATGSLNVTNVSPVNGDYYYVWTAADVTAGFAAITTVNYSDLRPQLYSERSLALNKTAPTALQGIDVHYGRLVGWKGDYQYNSKVTNPHSWPDEQAVKEAFVYGVTIGDGENIERCISFRESLFVFKKSNIFVFGGIGPDDTGNNAYTYRRLEANGLGCYGGKSCVVVGEDHNYLIYLSNQGFMATTGDKPVRVGEKIEADLFDLTDSVYSGAVAFHHKKLGVYICFLGGTSSKVGWVLDVRKDGDDLVGWFEWQAINASCVFWDSDRYIFGTPQGYCASERITGTASDLSDVNVEYVDPSDINTGTNVITVSQNIATATPLVIRSTGTLPAPLAALTTYYAINVSSTSIRLATSAANAALGTAIDITTQGTGKHSLVGSKAISAFYDTNWFKFGSATHVKKSGKVGVLLNALASSVNIDMQCAHDWSNAFTETHNISVGAFIAWGVEPWGIFVWGEGAQATPRNVAIARRKFRALQLRFSNNVINQDFNLQGIEIPFATLRNRGNFAE